MGLFSRSGLSERSERAALKTLEQIRTQRRGRFRILACIKTDEDTYNAVRFAARLAPGNDCDIILLYVRPIDHGLRSGGLQVRLARQNMLDAGLELPGLKALRLGLEVLKEEGLDVADWQRSAAHEDAWGDPAGDNKVEFTNADGRSIVLKLKTAPDPAAGILDQYELGPYNLIVLWSPTRWYHEFLGYFNASGVVQQVATLAPCSVMAARDSLDKEGFFLCTDGTARSMQAVRRSAVLAHAIGQPITLFSAAPTRKFQNAARENVENAKALLKAIGIEVAQTKVAIGDPTTKIIEHGANYQTIVVSDGARSKFHRVFRPSVAFDVFRGSDTSVIDVR